MKTHLIVFAAMLTFGAASLLGQDTPDTAPRDWRKKVTEAKALDDPVKRAEAMLALLREALPGREVRLSGSKYADRVHPDDNEPAPIVNFDPRLNQKDSAQSRAGTSTRSLQNNFGYYFSFRGGGYVVLGPAALDRRSPVFTRLAAEHELFHARNHVGDPRPLNDRELETWTEMFVTFFHDVHQFNQRWAPMLSYYERVDRGGRKAAIDRLVAYYRFPPSTAGDAASAAKVRAAFRDWLARRKMDTGSSKLVNDLEQATAALPAGE